MPPWVLNVVNTGAWIRLTDSPQVISAADKNTKICDFFVVVEYSDFFSFYFILAMFIYELKS